MDNLHDKMEQLLFILDCHPEMRTYFLVKNLMDKLDCKDWFIHNRLNKMVDFQIKYLDNLLWEKKQTLDRAQTRKIKDQIEDYYRTFQRELYNFMTLKDVYFFDGSDHFYS